MIPVEAMPPLMFGGLVLFMLIGYPVAFSLAALGFFFGFIAIEQGFFGLNYLQAIPGRVFGNVLSNDLLLAIPFFTFMGAVLERCGLAEDMLDSMGQLFGPIRGGLGYSGTITQLVPPSLVLIVLADQLGKSVGDMYLGAWGPSVLQIAVFALYTFAL